MCGGTQSPYLRAEVNTTTMEDKDNTAIHESASRGEAVGEERLREDEFICFNEQDFIGDTEVSVLMHMRSAHEVHGDREEMLYMIRDESKKYRQTELPSVDTEETHQQKIGEFNEATDTENTGFFSKLLNAVTFWK